MHNSTDAIIRDAYHAMHLIHRNIVVGDKSGQNKLHHRLAVLSMVNHAGSLPLSQIAQRLSLTKPQMTLFIDELVKEGAVLRSADNNDRRKLIVSLTDKGQTMLNEYLDAVRQSLNSKLVNLNPTEIEELTKALAAIVRLTSKL